MTPVAKILLCLALSLLTAFAVRLCLGDRHEKWFKRQIPKSVITLRTRLSMHLATSKQARCGSKCGISCGDPARVLFGVSFSINPSAFFFVYATFLSFCCFFDLYFVRSIQNLNVKF